MNHYLTNPANLRAIRAHMSMCLACLCTRMSTSLASSGANLHCVLPCSHAKVACILICSGANVLCMLHVPCVLTCKRALHA